MSTLGLSAEQIIDTLKLEKHIEGGYFYRSFYSEKFVTTEESLVRRQLSSIYYLLTKTSNFSCFARNRSDLVLYYHLGDPLTVLFRASDNAITEKILGPDILRGQYLQLPCPANTAKAYVLRAGEFCLIGEAVGPGFEYEDLSIDNEV